MLVHIFQADGHERDCEIATISHAGAAALEAAEKGRMQNGDCAAIAITKYNSSTGQFENTVWNVQIEGKKVFLLVNCELRFVGTVSD